MDSRYYGLIEMSYVFGLVLIFACWELYSLKRDKKKKPLQDEKKPGEAPPAKDDVPPTG